MKTIKIKFIANAVKWFDKVNGNTYHSVNITRVSDGQVIYCSFEYGYGDAYRQTALSKMLKCGWLPKDINKENVWQYERLNNYPIHWQVRKGLKRECVANGKWREK